MRTENPKKNRQARRQRPHYQTDENGNKWREDGCLIRRQIHKPSRSKYAK